MAKNSFRGTSRHPLKIRPSHYYLRLLGIKEPYIVAGAYMISCFLTLLAGYLGLVSA
jgi:phospho-N-acetylmuramoyl-pentapeptide-transferase